MTEKPIRTYQLNIEKLETLEDIKKILNTLQIRINTDNSLYEELKDYFPIEVVPKGYVKLIDAIGHNEVEKLTYEQIEQKIFELGLLQNEQTN
jgi:hypothetical protein